MDLTIHSVACQHQCLPIGATPCASLDGEAFFSVIERIQKTSEQGMQHGPPSPIVDRAKAEGVSIRGFNVCYSTNKTGESMCHWQHQAL